MKIAINGFGRIGRVCMRLAQERSDLEIVAVNSLGDLKTQAHLLKYDSVHGRFKGDVSLDGENMIVNGKKVMFTAERDPEKLPWGDIGVDVVLECTGIFRKRDDAAKHLKSGAKKVIISAPAGDADLTICMGINDQKYDPNKHHVVSNASCTTNALAPVAKVLHDNFGIKRALMTTVHSYTSDQRLQDLEHSDLRRSRAAAVNMIPTSTGAAKAIGLVIPELQGKFDGFAMRVTTPNVSVIDLNVDLEKDTSKEAINAAMKSASQGALKGILDYTDEPLVSGDFMGDQHSSIFDADSTMVIDKNFVKVISWYDNEAGYSSRMLDLASILLR